MTSQVSFVQKIMRSLQLGRACKIIWESSAQGLIVSAVLWTLNSLMPLFSLLLLKKLVDTATAAPSAGVSAESALYLVGILGVVTLLGNWCLTLANILDEVQSQKVSDHVADVLHAKSIELDLEYYDRTQFYGMLYRAQQEAPYRPFRIVKGLTRLAHNGLALLGMVGVLVSYHWWLTLFVFSSALPGVWVRLKHSRLIHAWQLENTENERRAGYYQSLLIEESYAKELRLFDLGPLFRRWFLDLRRQLREGKIQLLWRRSRADLAVQALNWLIVFAAVGYVVWEVSQGQQTTGDLILFFLAIQRGFTYFQELMSALNGLYEDNLFLANFYEFLDLRPHVVDPPQPRLVPCPFREGFVFEKVSFHYASSERKALQDVSLTIRPGQVVALVGENGAGKTTLVKLLCRLYDPTTGRITLDGHPLDQYAIHDLRSRISCIFQDFARYSLTLRENVWLGNITLPLTDPAVPETLGEVGGQNLIEYLPQHLDTLLGHWRDQGQELSGGEWQKVALARALVRRADLLIMDEPTSGLDAETESRFFADLRQNLQGRSALLISHRFSTIRQADQIYVLAQGQVIEQGSHEELIQRGGTYAEQYSRQAKLYEGAKRGGVGD